MSDTMTTVEGQDHVEPAPLTFGYTNWRGGFSIRRVRPNRNPFWFGETEYHPGKQWLLRAFDLDKGVERDFAVKDIGRIDGDLAAQLAAVTAERDHWRQLAEEGLDPQIESLHLEDGSFNMAVTGPAVEWIAQCFVGQFKAGGAVNYMEMNLFDRDEQHQRYTVTVQKVGALSPADKANAAEARVKELEAERDRYRGALSRIVSGPWPDDIDGPLSQVQWDDQIARAALAGVANG